MWSAGEFDFRGVKPMYYEPFNRTVHWQQRIDNIIPLLKQNESLVDFVMFYIDQPDFEDHAHSPSSPQVSSSIQQISKLNYRSSLKILPTKTEFLPLLKISALLRILLTVLL